MCFLGDSAAYRRLGCKQPTRGRLCHAILLDDCTHGFMTAVAHLIFLDFFIFYILVHLQFFWSAYPILASFRWGL
jgi:hypothetical protein